MKDSKFVLVTGCSSGFGKLTALALAEHGYTVFATLRAPGGTDRQTKQELEAAGGAAGRVIALAMDVSSDESVQRAFAEIERHTEHLDVVVNNAGVSAMGVAEAFTAEQVLSLLQVNTVGVHRVNRAALPLMRARRQGLLVHVSTGLSRLPMPMFGPYAASKAAVEVLAEVYRYELGPLGIDSVIVQPAAFPTRLGAVALRPLDTARLVDYGDLAALPDRMMAHLNAWFSGPDAPRAESVAEAILRLIETPAGQRPLRTTVGGGPDELNEFTDRAQRELLTSQGLGFLLELGGQQ